VVSRSVDLEMEIVRASGGLWYVVRFLFDRWCVASLRDCEHNSDVSHLRTDHIPLGIL
jgi:hypothetical protein